MEAAEVIDNAFATWWRGERGDIELSDAILAALRDAGFVVVERRPVTVHESMAEEWDRYKPALDYLADK